MSRSYRKYPLFCYTDYEPFNWRGFRILENMYLRKELKASDFGDEIFPAKILETSYDHSSRRTHYYCGVKQIRIEFLTDIRNILNGYCEHRKGKSVYDIQEGFIKTFYIIKNGEAPYKQREGFYADWLCDNDVKKIIKMWQGEPLDVLYYLAHGAFIEKAAVREHRRRHIAK